VNLFTACDLVRWSHAESVLYLRERHKKFYLEQNDMFYCLMLRSISLYPIAVFIVLILMISSSLSVSSASQTTQMTSSSSTGSFWTNASPMPTPRSEITATRLGDTIYVFGGFDTSGQPTDIVEAYSVKDNTWSQVAPLPHALHHTAASSFNGKIYVVGGYLDSQWTPSNRLFIYDPLTNQWQEGKSMPTARGALTANFINGILYAVGGHQSFTNDGILATNEAYDPLSDTWTSKIPMPTARHHAASAVADGKLYVIGGRIVGISATVNINANEMYDPNKNSWVISSSLEPMPSKRSGIAAASLSDSSSFYVFGGEEPSKTFNNNEKYDPKSNKWTIETPMPTARHGLAAVAIDDKIYVIGGGPQPGFSVTNANEIFHVR
jgi:N-acetylneuraminic acid mutarotase